ncbi:PilW family protein [Candidatus Nitrosacidococcus tergens]|uniref:Putative Fimbrial biogenesis protein n=1 Tax=Candidatus Nitrosacidococcus tergens TaxID=553981 RepID=A0A7G1Q956_9GAMM|nr:prepilin-type N-terminal cleavage/methylation domain-containing protein [Candidatus Nitrosacidococcus tergens]CAB1275145.1 putative Fimbrial biogenesis protein [Candidatus Nitrosacidococcus tergens]
MLTRFRAMGSQKGSSLVELMVSSTLGMIVMGGALAMMSSILKANNTTSQINYLNSELNVVMTMITRDLRRAGYWSGAISNLINNTTVPANPFAQITVSTDSTCIVFSYDADKSGTLTNANQFGYRLDTSDNAVEVRQAGAGCSDSGWQNLTDESALNITNLQFDDLSPPALNTGSGITVQIRKYRITLEGQLNSDSQISKKLETIVKVKNNQYF